MSEHNFNILIAQKYGTNEAIFINNLIHLNSYISFEDSDKYKFHNGRHWVNGTPEYFSLHLPYFKPRLIKNIIFNCIQKELLLKGNFNKNPLDKTNWYAISDKTTMEINN